MKQLKFLLSGMVVVLALCGSAVAETTYLSPTRFDPALLLPPPPSDDSEMTSEELAELHRIQDARTSDRFARAEADGKNETVTIFDEVLGPAFDPAKLPATAKLFDGITHDEEEITAAAKKYFHRTRPYVLDTSLKDCGHDGHKGVYASYPSGHATVGYAMGYVLAELVPAKAQAILSRSEDFAESRLVCGVHFRRDIEAGHVLGTVIALNLMQNAGFKADFAAAAAELRAEHIAE